MPAAKTRPPFQISSKYESIDRGGKIFYSVTDLTQAEHSHMEAVLLAMNTLDLSAPKARLAFRTVLATFPDWRISREEELVEEPASLMASPDHQQCTTSGAPETQLWSIGVRQYPTKRTRGSDELMQAAKTRPPLKMSASDEWIVRDGKIFYSVDGLTKAEYAHMEAVLLALNALDLSEPKALRAIKAVVRTSPTWCAGRTTEQVEALS